MVIDTFRARTALLHYVPCEEAMHSNEIRDSIVLKNRGQKIFGVLHRPLGLANYPGLVICHGLAGHKTGRYRIYVRLSKMLAEAGIASLRIDFRGSGDSEGDFGEMTLDSEVSDALKALEFLRQDPQVDASRLGLFGRSIGGTVAVLAARRYGLIKSLATWAPVFDGEQWHEKWKMLNSMELTPEYRHHMMSVNGQVPGNEFFKQLFALRMDDELKSLDYAPLLHIHGELDNVIHIDHANRFYEFRRNAKGENKFIRLPRSDHDFSDPIEQQIALEKTCQWFLDTLSLK